MTDEVVGAGGHRLAHERVAAARELIRSGVDTQRVNETLKEVFDLQGCRQPLEVFVIALSLLASVFEEDTREGASLDQETANLLRSSVPHLLESFLLRHTAPTVH